jgi:amidohydrolase
MKQLLEKAESIKAKLIEWRRAIHENPELGLELPETVNLVERELKAMGYQPRRCGGGVVAVLEGAAPGKTILLRADMDALPMREESGLPFASKVENAAHTCGHDTHTAMLLGAALLLREQKDRVKGRIKLMFQPGEEIGKGARAMIDAGLLENPPVDVAVGFHAMVAAGLDSGKIGWYQGPALASADVFRIDVAGKGTHGSRPETGVDPVNILCHIQNLLQTINSREKLQLEPVVLTVCQIAAGDAPNILPERGFMTGTIRTYNQEQREFVKNRLVQISEGAASLLRGEAKVTFTSGMFATINNQDVCDELVGYFRELVGPENVVNLPSQMASEDFSEVMTRVPGAFFRVGMGSLREGYTYNGHNPKVIFDENALPIGTAAYAYGAVRWLEEHAN